MEPYKKIAHILRTDQDVILDLEKKMNASFCACGIMKNIMDQNEVMIKNRLEKIGVKRNALAHEIYDALIVKIKKDDENLCKFMDCSSPESEEHYAKILDKAKELAEPKKGLFMKLDKAREFIANKPPLKVMEALGYTDVKDMLEKEDIFEVFAALRFIEGSEWLNGVFFTQYATLTPDDFEKREVKVKALGYRWVDLSQDFVKKKYHNISHLKELGLIFTLPVTLGIPGEMLRGLSLILHYFNEVAFYSDLIKNIAKKEETFSKNLISLLRGDTIDTRLEKGEKARWMVVARYFAKDDEYDWRLFEPHINPEALHWEKAERMLEKLPVDLSFWKDLNWVGDNFKTSSGVDIIVSFNLVDTVMSLVKSKEMIKYLYHYQEALWNKIFSEYAGEKKLEEMMKGHILDGWFEI